MTTLLQALQLGNPLLRQIAKPVKNVTDTKIQTLIDDLIATLMKINGVGMSAPQVGESIQLFIVASHPNPRYPHAPNMEPTPVINPKIITKSKSTKKDYEGCLSVPGMRALIPRSTKISVEFTDRSGNVVKQTFTDFIARIFQHEYDHLQGLVFLDRIESTKDIITDQEYLKLVAAYDSKKK
jgi:peptide deformylase